MILVATQSISLGEGLLTLLAAIAPDRSSEHVTTTAAVFNRLAAVPVELIVLDAELMKDPTENVLRHIETHASATHYLILAETVEQHEDLQQQGVEEVLLKGTPAPEIAVAIERLLEAG